MRKTSDDRFLFVQRRRIEHDKWCEGISLQKDPGSEYVMQWIHQYAGNFRMAWNNSLCRGCRRFADCGLDVQTSCDRFEKLAE